MGTPASTPDHPHRDDHRGHRRRLLRRSAWLAGCLAGLGLWPAAARAQAGGPAPTDARPAFQGRSLAAVLQALGAAAPQPDDAVLLELPDVAENGAVVPVRLATTLPGAARLALLIERNPAMLSALFEPGPQMEPDFTLRVKLAESTDVYAVALLEDGRVRYARRHCTVVLGGCA